MNQPKIAVRALFSAVMCTKYFLYLIDVALQLFNWLFYRISHVLKSGMLTAYFVAIKHCKQSNQIGHNNFTMHRHLFLIWATYVQKLADEAKLYWTPFKCWNRHLSVFINVNYWFFFKYLANYWSITGRKWLSTAAILHLNLYCI